MYLYHRTNHYKDIEGIVIRKEIVPSKNLLKKETRCGSHAHNFVSLTEGKCVETGGKFQIVLDKEKILKKNNISNTWKKIDPKGPESIFLHELEWRSCDPVKIEKNDIKELVLYKNYMTVRASRFEKLSEHKREMTIAEKGFIEVCKKHDLPCRIVPMKSKECDEKERITELKNILKDVNIKISTEKPLRYEYYNKK